MTDSKIRGKGKEQVKKLKLKKETLRDLDVKRTAKKVRAGGKGEYPSQYICTLSCVCTMENTCVCTHTCLYTCPCR